MKRLLIAGTTGLLLTIITGTAIVPDALMQSFASSEFIFQLIRLTLIALLIGLFYTAPPRRMQFRTMLGMSSVFLAAVTVAMLFSYYISLLDALVFIEVAIIFAIDALELSTVETSRGKGVLAQLKTLAQPKVGQASDQLKQTV